MRKPAIEIVYETLKAVPVLGGRVYKLKAQKVKRPFAILNSTDTITFDTLKGSKIIGDFIRVDYFANTMDFNENENLEQVFQDGHDALMNTGRVISFVNKYTDEMFSTPDKNFDTTNAVYIVSAVYRIASN